MMCQTCGVCEANRQSKSYELLKPTALPKGPWYKVEIDAFELEKVNYLVAVDYYSRYFDVMHLPDMTSKTTIMKMKALFGRYGIPYEVRTDGAKQFVCKEFAEFSTEYNFKHEVSSPTYARSNGEAEAYVKIAKKCLKQDDPALSLLLYRSTPHAATGVAPATLFMGRKLRTTLPTLLSNLTPKYPDESLIRQRDATYKQNMAYFHDKRHGCKSEANFNVGDNVRTKTDNQNEWTPATVKSKTPYPRSYMLQTSDGRTLRRNSKHIMQSKAPANVTPKPNSDDREALFQDFLDRRMQSFNSNAQNKISNTDGNNENISHKSTKTDVNTKKTPVSATSEQSAPTVNTTTRYG